MAALTLPADAAIARVRAGRRHRVRRRILAMSIMSVLVVVLFGAMLMLGNTIYPLSDVLAVLSGQQVPGASFAVGTLRLPRALTAILAGFAFGVAAGGGPAFGSLFGGAAGPAGSVPADRPVPAG